MKIEAVVKSDALRLLFFEPLLDNLGAAWTIGTKAGPRRAPAAQGASPANWTSRRSCALHPNKRADRFRQLVAGAAAFNALSRSSLLVAEHPEDADRRVLVGGKGNLSRTPAGVEFTIVSHRFTANSHNFDVPRVVDMTAGTLTVDDLVASSNTNAGPSKVGDACEIIEALLPRDGDGTPRSRSTKPARPSRSTRRP